MSLKDEIEKIIRAERDKFESRDQREKEFKERQRERFRLMRSLLKELAASIGAQNLEISIDADDATVKVVQSSDAYFGKSWRIEPNFDFNLKSREGELRYREAPGIRIEVVQRSGPEEILEFDGEEKAMAYLVGKIAEQIAYHQHRNKLSGKGS